MKNTERLFEALKAYQDVRKKAVDAYDNRLKEIATTKGSEYYSTETKKAADSRDKAIREARETYGKEIDSTLADMAKTNEGRAMTPPSEAQLRLLSALKLRDNVTEQELEAAANTCKDNPVSIAVINEIAAKSGALRRFSTETGEMSTEATNARIQSLSKDIRNFLDSDKTEAAQIYGQRMAEMYGVQTNGGKREIFTNKSDCFRVVAGMSGDTLNAFCDAVDGAGNE